MKLSKSTLGAAVAIAMGAIAVPASANTLQMNWDGVFTMLDSAGGALANSSIVGKPALVNKYQTAVTGTMDFDTVTGAGAATMVPFDFYNGSLPAEAVGINLQAIGDGMGGPGPLVMGNMLFNWNGTYGIPVSIVMDGTGMFGAMQGGAFASGPGATIDQSTVAGFGAIPASDGTYTGLTFGYLGLGPVPMATTEWNLSPAAGCESGCMNVAAPGTFPMVVDTATNTAEYYAGDGVGVGGVPMWGGPFAGFNANFDITSVTLTNVIPGEQPAAVPVPAAVWLFGSGLLGLVGVARRKQAA